MKTLLVALILAPTIAFAAEVDGRYMAINGQQPYGSILVDSKTGKSWSVGLSSQGGIIYTPIMFMCGENVFSYLPACSDTVKSEKKSKITYMDDSQK